MIIITVEELDIIVQASVEQALKEFGKIVPEIKKATKGIESEINKTETKGLVNKVRSAVENIKVHFKGAEKNIQNSVQKAVTLTNQELSKIGTNSSTKQLETQFIKAGQNVEKYSLQLEQVKQKLRSIYADMDKIQDKTWKSYTPDGLNINDPMVEKAVQPSVDKALNSDKEYKNLILQEEKLNSKVEELNNKLKQAKQNYSQIESQIKQANSSQSSLSNSVKKLKNNISNSKVNATGLKKSLSSIQPVTSKLTNNVGKVGIKLKTGLSHILRYAGALLSLRGIYNILSSSASSWLSSQNAGAKQLLSNIEYMKYAMGSAFAPVIEYVTNLIYKLMKAIQSVVYALFKVNIFANASSKSYASMANSASKAKKETQSLAGIHSDINNIQSNDNTDSDNGSGNISPNIDLSNVDGKITAWFDKYKDKFKKLFEPFQKAWQNQGKKTIESAISAFNKSKEAIKSMGKSWEEVWTNGTGQYTIELILSIFQNIFNIIGNIAEAWNNAWNSDNRGTQLIQTMWDVLNKLLELINALSQRIIEFTANPIVQKYFENAIEMVTNFWKVLGGLIEMLTGLVEGDWSKIWNGFKDIISGAFGFIWNIINEKILMVTAIISNSLETIKQLWNDGWNHIKNFAFQVWDNFLNKIDQIFPGMRNIIENNISNIRNKINNSLNNISNSWNNTWNNVKHATSNIFNGIYNAIKNPINWILSGIEKMANGVVRGINKVVQSLNGMHFTMPSWLGGGSFGINLPTISGVSLPRLAKGNVAYSETMAIFGEYAGASTNPEITAPQNIMYDTMVRALENTNTSSDRPIRVQIYWGVKEVVDEVIDGINEKSRRTGKAQIKVAYD